MTSEHREPLTTAKKLDLWNHYRELSRSWALAMDAKAGFLSALNVGLIAALWTSAALTEQGLPIMVRCAGGTATVLACVSIFYALMAALPRDHWPKVFGGGAVWVPQQPPISFYGHVAREYPLELFGKFQQHAIEANALAASTEALEQHFVIAHTVARKSRHVEIAGYWLMGAVVATAATLLIRLFM